MGNSIHHDRPREIENLLEYLRLKEVRANTALIGGKIIYNGQEYDEKTYNEIFPSPVIKYKPVQIDTTQIER